MVAFVVMLSMVVKIQPLSINFPAALAARWMPGLFPDSSEPVGV